MAQTIKAITGRNPSGPPPTHIIVVIESSYQIVFLSARVLGGVLTESTSACPLELHEGVAQRAPGVGLTILPCNVSYS